MGTCIIPQPNGLFCVYCTTTDCIAAAHLDRDGLVEFMWRRHWGMVEVEVDHAISSAEEGRTRLGPFELTCTGMLDHIAQVCGPEEARKAAELIRTPPSVADPHPCCVPGPLPGWKYDGYCECGAFLLWEGSRLRPTFTPPITPCTQDWAN